MLRTIAYFIVISSLLIGCVNNPPIPVAIEPSASLLLTPTGAPLKWDKDELPLTVLLSPGLPEEIITNVVEATAKMNLDLGVVVFESPRIAPTEMIVLVEILGRIPPRGVIYVKQEQIKGQEHRADTADFHKGDGTLFSAVVRLPQDPEYRLGIDEKVARNVLTHEFAHSLGLGHDPQGISLMSPTAMPYQRFTRSGRELLRTIYNAGAKQMIEYKKRF